MFSRRFEQLKTYKGIDPQLAELLKRELLLLPQHLRKRVTINYVSRKLGLPMQVASDLMYAAYRCAILQPNFDIVCPFCDKTFKVVNDLSLIPIENIKCEECEEEFVPDPRKVWVTYSVRPEFINLSSPEIDQIRDDTTSNKAFSLFDAFADPEKFLDQLFKPNLQILKTLINSLSTGKTNDEKKKLLENLAQEIVSSIVGFVLIDKNVRVADAEIDRVYRNCCIHPILQELGNPITVECKNYDEAVGANHIRIVNDILREYGARTCLYLSVKGVTGNVSKDGWHRVLDAYQKDNKLIPVFKLSDYEEILNGKNFLETLLEKSERIKLKRAKS